MPPTRGSALALAARLRSLDDAELTSLIRSREFRDGNTRDFFDLAERLLDPASVHAALATLDRPTLAALANAGMAGAESAGAETTGAAGASSPAPSQLAAAISLALTDEVGVPYESVTAVLDAWPASGLPSAAELARLPPATLEAVQAADRERVNRGANERAFSTTTAIVELLAELNRASARELVKGGIALPDARRLSAATHVELDALPVLLAIAGSAGLVINEAGSWSVAPAANDWCESSSAERWVVLATSWFAQLHPQIRTLLAERSQNRWGDHLTAYVAWLYPASVERTQDRVRAQATRAELLGIALDGVPSSAGIAILQGDTAVAEQLAAEGFPPTVDKAYIQRDLTIVSTGPLTGAIDTRLRSLAELESTGLATTWRISADSLERALAGGDTGDGIRAFLSELSLTGIPQPLGYLIDESQRRHGLVRVGTAGSGSYVRSTDAALLRQVGIDRSIGNLGLRPVHDHLESRFDRDLVYWALREARYPVAAEDPNGAIVTVQVARRAPRAAATRDHAAELVSRLREGTDDTSDDAWLERQLDVAVRNRTVVTVTVAMPDGSHVDYTLEPTGIGGGRLRGRDRKSDIERTLPLASIVDVKN